MTVLEVIQKSADYLARKGVESARLHAELLLAHVLGLPRMELYLQFARELAPKDLDALRALVQRRGRREPLQHILGSVAFCGLDLVVNRHVLVPRPETELLAEEGWTYLNQLSPQECPCPSVLDFGTGSGCLAIALAVKCPRAKIWATDLSAEALAVARQNALRHQVADRIQFVAGAGLRCLPAEVRFDLMVSNPPYIPSAEIASLQPEVRDYEPRYALDGGPDGLDYFRQLAAEAGAFLQPAGRMMLEFGDGQAEKIRAVFEGENWVVEAVKADYTGRPRIAVARRAAPAG